MFRKNFPFAICAAALAILAAGPAAAQQTGGADIPPDTAEVLAVANPMRQARGIAPLRYAPELTQAAGPEAENLAAKFFGDPVTDNASPFERVEAAGYRSIRVRAITYTRPTGSPSLQQHLLGTPALQQTLLDPVLTDVGSARRHIAQQTPQGKRSAEVTAIYFGARQGETTPPPGGGTATPTPAVPAMDEERVMLAAHLETAINQWRATYGVPSLKRIAVLDNAADRHSQDMAKYGYLGHQGSDGSGFTHRVAAAGYKWQALTEMISYGRRTPAQEVAQWMKDPSGRARLLSSHYTDLGIGVARHANGALFWTIVPARPSR